MTQLAAILLQLLGLAGRGGTVLVHLLPVAFETLQILLQLLGVIRGEVFLHRLQIALERLPIAVEILPVAAERLLRLLDVALILRYGRRLLLRLLLLRLLLATAGLRRILALAMLQHLTFVLMQIVAIVIQFPRVGGQLRTILVHLLPVGLEALQILLRRLRVVIGEVLLQGLPIAAEGLTIVP